MKGAALLSIALVCAPVTLCAQTALTTANGTTSLVATRTGGLDLDFNESKVSATFFSNSYITTSSPNYSHFALTLSVAARKGNRDILSEGTLNPEFAASVTWVKRIEADEAGFTAFYASLGGSAARGLYAVSEGAGLQTLGKVVSRAATATIGVNHAFSQDNILGFAVSGTANRGSTKGFSKAQVCATQATGRRSSGQLLTAQTCEDRYMGDPRDLGSYHFRADWTPKIWTPAGVDSVTASDNAPSFGLITSLSADLLNDPAGREWTVNFAIGPTLHPEGFPHELRGAVLFELDDVGNVSNKPFEKRFFIRLYARVPFEGL